MGEQTPNVPEEVAKPFGVQRAEKIFLVGLARMKPEVPVAFPELEAKAQEMMSKNAFGYVSGNAGLGHTAQGNRDAFNSWEIVPRMMRDVSQRDLSVEVLGQRYPFPVFLAPVGVQEIIHKDAELATARAAKQIGVPMVLSTFSSTPMEKVAEVLGDAPRWFQLYWPRVPEICLSFLERAERSGYSALVVTLDTGHIGWRPADLQNAYSPFARGDGLANYLSDPTFRAMLNLPEKVFDIGAVKKCLPLITNPTITWDDLKFLKEHTKLPIVLKGILHPDDARRAVEEGVAGIIVSNHGGRQVDGSVAALDALVEVVDAVGDKVDVMFDSGIRCGADVCKALALGAKATFVGRPYCYGLAIAGEDGVREVLSNFMAEVDLTLGLSGGVRLADLKGLVRRVVILTRFLNSRVEPAPAKTGDTARIRFLFAKRPILSRLSPPFVPFHPQN